MPMFRSMMLAVLFLTAALGPAAAVAQDTPVRGGTIVAAISADPGHLNPPSPRADPRTPPPS